jgi:hypothetical protein
MSAAIITNTTTSTAGYASAPQRDGPYEALVLKYEATGQEILTVHGHQAAIF